MHYDIIGLCPRMDLDMGRHGFGIKLYPEWEGLVTNRALTQENVETALENLGRLWLDACGFDRIFDPDNCGHDKDLSKPPGPEARPSYRPNEDLRVSWGPWGPEHISVPGNACGLDLDQGIDAPQDGRTLQPHNIDTVHQKLLLLVVFTWFAEDLALNWQLHDKP